MAAERTVATWLQPRCKGTPWWTWDICNGDVVIFQHSDFEYVEHGKILVVEKIGEEEGWGAWSLKRLIVEQPRSFTTNEFAEEIDWDDPVLVLRSHNRSVNLWPLDPSGHYRIRGFLRRWLRPEDVH